MNCVEFRRQLGIDPHCVADEFLRHRVECARCAAAAARALGRERELLRALAIDVPAQLADTVLFGQTTAERLRRTRLRRFGGFALAAALVLAVGIVGMRAEASPLPAQVVAHVRREAAVLRQTDVVPAAMTRQAFRSLGVALRDVPDGISFVACCPLERRRTVHLVMRDGEDPISVIWVAERVVDRGAFERDGWHGRVTPLGTGTLILLAQSPRAFDRIEAQWRAAIETRG